ncbi:MAG: hypothetical protein GY828_04780 [Candidatus Gracilibacteria bacterium]|nr:hypothetical protein [Candidatus Gracilibacteria bacterium]
MKKNILFLSIVMSPVAFAGIPLCENGDYIDDCPWEWKAPISEVVHNNYIKAEERFLRECGIEFSSFYTYKKERIVFPDRTKKNKKSYIMTCEGKNP